MGIVLFVMGAVVALFAALFVGGMLLPMRQSVARSVTLHAAPRDVWARVAEPATYPEWRSDTVTSVDIESTAPLRWREFGDDRIVSVEALTMEPPSRFVARVTDEDLVAPTEWTYDLTPFGEGTVVVLTEVGAVSNPIARFVRHYIASPAGAVDRMLVALGETLGERVTPRAA